MEIRIPKSPWQTISIAILLISLINFTKCENNSDKMISNLNLIKQHEANKNNSYSLAKVTSLSEWWETITSGAWNWIKDSTIRHKDSAVSEGRTFAKIRKLQLALLPIMFKFGVLSALISALVFLSMKSVFLLKTLFLINLAVIFGKFFAWKSELSHKLNHGGGWGGWGPPPPPSIIHSSPPHIIESHPPHFKDNKEIHVHVHTSKNSDNEHHTSHYIDHPPIHHEHHENGYSHKRNSYVDLTRERRNSTLNENHNRKLEINNDFRTKHQEIYKNRNYKGFKQRPFNFNNFNRNYNKTTPPASSTTTTRFQQGSSSGSKEKIYFYSESDGKFIEV